MSTNIEFAISAGYHYDLYDEDEEGLKFNPYTSTYDDGYGDLYFDDVEQEVATCRLGEDGQPKFNGGSKYLQTPTFRFIRQRVFSSFTALLLSTFLILLDACSPL